MRKTIIFLLIAASLIAMASCSKRAITRKYYIIELNDYSSIPKAEKLLPYKVDVRDFRVAKAYDQTRIAIRTRSHELNYYFYHHWAVKPSFAIADVVFNILNKLNLFENISRGYTFNPDYVITGQVNNLERMFIQDTESAHLSAIFELRNARSGLPEITYSFDKEVLLKEKSMNGFAEAISNTLKQQTLQFAQKIQLYFQSQSEK